MSTVSNIYKRSLFRFWLVYARPIFNIYFKSPSYLSLLSTSLEKKSSICEQCLHIYYLFFFPIHIHEVASVYVCTVFNQRGEASKQRTRIEQLKAVGLLLVFNYETKLVPQQLR